MVYASEPWPSARDAVALISISHAPLRAAREFFADHGVTLAAVNKHTKENTAAAKPDREKRRHSLPRAYSL
jgi:hypothetical protein